MYMCAWACRDSKLTVGSQLLSIFLYWSRVSLWTWHLPFLASLYSHHTPEFPVSTGNTGGPHVSLAFMWVLGFQTSVLMLEGQVLYLLSHLPRHHICLTVALPACGYENCLRLVCLPSFSQQYFWLWVHSSALLSFSLFERVLFFWCYCEWKYFFNSIIGFSFACM